MLAAHRNAKEMVAELEAEIRAGRQKGYTLTDIAAISSELSQMSATKLRPACASWSAIRPALRPGAAGPPLQ